MKKKIVFILDSDKYHRSKFKRVIESISDLEVREFESSLLMLHVMKTFIPDMIILELQMPVVNGLSVLQYLRSQEETATMPIVICTNDYSIESRNIADSLGHNGIHYQPIQDVDFMKTVQAIVNNYDSIREHNAEFLSVSKSQPQRIMSVDDEMAIRLIFRNIVTHKMQLDFIDFSNPIAALDYVQSPNLEHIDLIIVDMKMPDMDGVTFLKKIRELEHCKHIKVIACTAENDITTIQEFLKLGIVDFLAKPFDQEVALKKITNAIYC